MTDSLLQKVAKKTKELNKKDNHALLSVNERRKAALYDKDNYLNRLYSSTLDLVLEEEEGVCSIDVPILNYYYYTRLLSEAADSYWESLPRVPMYTVTPGYENLAILIMGAGTPISWPAFSLCLAAVNGLKDKKQVITRQNGTERIKAIPAFAKVDFRRENAKHFMKLVEIYRNVIYG